MFSLSFLSHSLMLFQALSGLRTREPTKVDHSKANVRLFRVIKKSLEQFESLPTLCSSVFHLQLPHNEFVINELWNFLLETSLLSSYAFSLRFQDESEEYRGSDVDKRSDVHKYRRMEHFRSRTSPSSIYRSHRKSILH